MSLFRCCLIRSLPVALFGGIVPAVVSSAAFAEGSATPSPGLSAGFQPQGDENKPVRAAIPGEAKTLPQGVYRLRTVYSAARSESGFSDNGKREDGGWRATLDAGAFAVEYGLRPGISLQLVAPVVIRSERGLDVQKFRNSSLYAQIYEDKLNQVIDKLVSNKLCADAATCRVAIEEKSLSFPFTTVVLDTGETLELKTAVPIKNVLRSLVSNAAVPESGRTGRGDLELGALVSVADPEVGLVRHWDVNVSLGLGLRVPTGFFEDVPSSQRPTGRGSWDLGLRANVDKVFSENLVVSWQNQSELTLRDGKKRRTSLLDNTRLNTADPSVEGGDGKPNTGGFRRTTTRQVGFVKLAWGGEVLHQSLDTFVLNSVFKYDFDSPGEVDGQSLGSETSLMSAQLGVTWDGLRVSLPVQLDLDYTFPLAGKNIPSAPALFTSTLKVYLKI